MFAKKAAGGGSMTKELKRHLEHQSIQAAKLAEEEARAQTKVRLNIHAKSASNLIAVDNRQFSMTSDPYVVAQILIGGALDTKKGTTQQTRALKRTLAPKWDEWLQLDSKPLNLFTPSVDPYVALSDDSDEKRAGYVEQVLRTTAQAEAELMAYAKKLKLRMDVYDYDALSEDDPLGHCTISIADIIECGEERRKKIYELIGEFDLKYTVGMNKKYKGDAMTGTLQLTLQLALPKLPPAFNVDVPALIARLRPKVIEKDFYHKLKFKPFHCKLCSRRFKKSETLMLHYHLHDKEEQARRHVEEEKQRLLENQTLEHVKQQQKIVQQQQQQQQHDRGGGGGNSSSVATRKVTAASTKNTWLSDCSLGRKDAVIKGLTQGFFLVNVRDPHCRSTPLIVASRWGEGPLVKALLMRKADVSAMDMHGNSSLAFAAQYGHLNIITMLLNVKNGGKEMMNVSNKMNVTPLHRAAMYNNKEVVEMLLRDGADAVVKDRANRTALEYARLYKHEEVTSVLEHWEVMLSQVVSGGKQ